MEHVGLRLLVDIGVGKKVERWLQEHGHDVKSVRDIDPRMSDKEILKIAIFRETAGSYNGQGFWRAGF